ncbi:hypothetical protein PG985_008337 [Apiospora marii]|uniref:Uncharacterized protein n=1 Tax=Apiospora marii TaxID=335849 RepID=A0ABR1SRP6_9PEZI
MKFLSAAALLLASTATAAPATAASSPPTCLMAKFRPADRAECTAPDGQTSAFLRVQLDRNLSGQERCFNLGATYSVSVSYTPKGSHAQAGPPVQALNGPVRVADGARGQYDFDFPIRYGDIEPGTHVVVAAEAMSSDGTFGGTEERAFIYVEAEKGSHRGRRSSSHDEEAERAWTTTTTYNDTLDTELHGLVAERGATYALPQC